MLLRARLVFLRDGRGQGKWREIATEDGADKPYDAGSRRSRARRARESEHAAPAVAVVVVGPGSQAASNPWAVEWILTAGKGKETGRVAAGWTHRVLLCATTAQQA